MATCSAGGSVGSWAVGRSIDRLIFSPGEGGTGGNAAPDRGRAPFREVTKDEKERGRGRGSWEDQGAGQAGRTAQGRRPRGGVGWGIGKEGACERDGPRGAAGDSIWAMGGEEAMGQKQTREGI